MTDHEHQTLRTLCAGLHLSDILMVLVDYCVERRSSGQLTNEEAGQYGKLQRKLEYAYRHSAEWDL